MHDPRARQTERLRRRPYRIGYSSRGSSVTVVEQGHPTVFQSSMITRLILNIVGLVFSAVEWALLWPAHLFRARRRNFVKFKLQGTFKLAGPTSFLARRRGSDCSLERLAKVLRRVESRPGIEGVLVSVGRASLAAADAELVRSELQQVRDKGKRVVVHFDGAGPAEMIVASAADTVLMSPAGQIMLLGPKAELQFLRRPLGRLGVKPQFLHIGKFKTAAHMFIRETASDSQRSETERIVEGMGGQIASLIRHGESDSNRAAWPFSRPLYDVQRARLAGLIDHHAYPDQVGLRLRAEGIDDLDALATEGNAAKRLKVEAELKKVPKVHFRSAKTVHKARPRPIRWRPILKRNQPVAIVDMSGMILDDSVSSSPFQQNPTITPKSVRRVFKDLRERSQVRAVVLAIDSRGGSAAASDLIWHEVRRLRQKKPVIAFLRSVAASGGYYIAVGADHIVAQELTLTGSIGVIMGKFSTADALSRLEIGTETLAAAPFATLLSSRSPFDDHQVALLKEELRSTYRRFVSRVAIGRSLKSDEVHRLARGRIFTGSEAKVVHLVDDVGSIQTAVNLAAKAAKIPTDRVELDFLSLEKSGLLSHLGLGGLGGSSPFAGMVVPSKLAELTSFMSQLRQNPILAYSDFNLDL